MNIHNIMGNYYDQIEKDAIAIWESIRETETPFEGVISQITDGQSSLVLNDYEDVERYIAQLKIIALAKCEKMDPEYALPILVQMYTNFYSIWSSKPAWLGVAVKYTSTLIWANTKPEPGKMLLKDLSLLKEAILTVQVLHNLESSLYFKYFINEPFSFNGEGIQGSNHLLQVMNEFYAAFTKGNLQRTWEESTQVFMSKPDEALEAVERILNGESPDQQPIFCNTIFANIGKSEPIEFWTAIWARLHLLVMSIRYRHKGTSNSLGVTVFPDSALIRREKLNIDNKKLEIALHELFWSDSWYRSNKDLIPHELLIYRPAMRIRDSNVMYVTSFFLILDSLGNYIESSIMGYHGPSVRLSEKFRKKFISDHFENKVVQKFRDAGFISGGVETNGEWKVGESAISLKTHGNSLKGEVDVLAYHPGKNILVLLECKVYELPSSPNQMRNLLKKFGEGDKAKLNRKLSNKLEWIIGTEYFSAKKPAIFQGLVLDRRFPGMFHDDFVVLDEGSLDQVITELLALE